ncbi:MAG: hypothetical protein ACPG7W_05635 [Paracoccaceae bacterium]
MIAFCPLLRRCWPYGMALLAAASAQATPMTAEDFDAYTRGKTLTYGVTGHPYGAEQYRDGRRVVWSFLDGRCQDGLWYPQEDQICFVYDTPSQSLPSGAALEPQCWIFTQEPDGLRAMFVGPGRDTTLYEIQESPTPLLCYGPDVGV